MTNNTDYYSILQVSPKATSEDIKMSFRRLARLYHPDLNPNNPETAEHFKQISEAYEILSDEIKRRRYDSDRNLRQKSSYSYTTSYTSSNYASSKNASSKNASSEPKPEAREAQDFYLRGLEKSQNKQYQKAIKEYSKAIELNPNFVDAYLKRCEMRYKLGDNQGVLDDCYRVIQIKSSVPKAYYYQGRARFSLGYVQAAIDSYSEAIRQAQNYPQAYYYRGIAHLDLKDRLSAMEDWQVAAELFRNEGNQGAYRLTKNKLNALNQSSFHLGSVYGAIVELVQNTLITFISYFYNPLGGLLPAFTRLSSSQATGIGLIYGAIAALSLTGSNYLLINSPQLSLATSSFSFGQLFLINFLPFICLTLISAIARVLNNIKPNLAQDLFLAGTSFLPLGLAFLAVGFFANPQGITILPLLTLLIFGFSLSILTLYANCTQIIQLSEARTTFLTPLMIVISVGCHYFIKSFWS